MSLQHEPFDWDHAEPDLLDAFTETIADNPPDNAAMVTTVWAMEILTELSDRGYVLVPTTTRAQDGGLTPGTSTPAPLRSPAPARGESRFVSGSATDD